MRSDKLTTRSMTWARIWDRDLSRDVQFVLVLNVILVGFAVCFWLKRTGYDLYSFFAVDASAMTVRMTVFPTLSLRCGMVTQVLIYSKASHAHH